MKVNPNIFKAYDIRGIYPQEINEKTAYLIGQAFVKFLTPRQNLVEDKLNIVVGRDARLSSPVLFKSLVRGITEAGANVIDIGLSTSPMLYWACGYYGFDGGIEITASHNPPDYNGFKFVSKGAFPISERTGLKQIKRLIQSPDFKKKRRGKIIDKNIISEYIKFNFKKADSKKIKKLKIVVDSGNGVSGLLLPKFFKPIPSATHFLFLKLDGSFPNHPPDISRKENLRFLQKEVIKKKADLGVAFDGDGDRIVFVDEKGRILSPDLISALIISVILKEKPGQKILYDIRSSNFIKTLIKDLGGKAVLGKVGHPFAKEKMRKENSVFGGGFTGHYYFKDHYFSEAPLFVLLIVLKEVSKSGRNLSQLVKPFQKYFHSGEINFKVKDKKKILTKLEKIYKKGRLSHLDGLRIDFKDWWFLARPSHTEPVLRLIIEAKTKKLMEKKKKELTKLICEKNEIHR